jgi:hypothetical protein
LPPNKHAFTAKAVWADLKTGWSPWINELFCLDLINQPPVLKSHFVSFSNSLYFQMVSLFYT